MKKSLPVQVMVFVLGLFAFAGVQAQEPQKAGDKAAAKSVDKGKDGGKKMSSQQERMKR